MQEVLHDAIQQIEHLQDTITDLTREPMLASTVGTIHLLEDAIKSDASMGIVEIQESNYLGSIATKQELITRLYNLKNQAQLALDANINREGLVLAVKEALETLKKVKP